MIVIITAGIYLTACGSRDGEELIQIGQESLEDDIGTKITLSDITWVDCNSGNELQTFLFIDIS